MLVRVRADSTRQRTKTYGLAYPIHRPLPTNGYILEYAVKSCRNVVEAVSPEHQPPYAQNAL